MATEYPERFKSFFNELETRRTLLTTITETHNKLINNFNSLDETLTKKSQILDTQIDNFKKNTEKTLEALTVRENSIAEKELTLSSRVEQLKDSSIRDIKKGDNLDPKDKTISGKLRMLFRRMDSKCLVKFLLARRKDSATAVREEITAATEEAVDLLRLVLEVIEEFVELRAIKGKVKRMADRRWVCGVLIQAALPLPLAVDGGEQIGGGVARSLKDRAAKVLENWKVIMDDGQDDRWVGSGEATMFLKMVIGFGIKHKFDDEFLKQLVLEFANKNEIVKIAVALRFGDKMRDIIKELVKMGKEIEAVNFASETGLTDEFPLVPLLESSIRNYWDNDLSDNSSSLDDVSNELLALKKITRCIQHHKLESHFTYDNLQKRVNKLEKIKEDKKRLSTIPLLPPASKPLNAKRPRSERPPHQPCATRFTYMNPRVYESNPTVASYRGAGSKSPVLYGLQYAYPAQETTVTPTDPAT